MSFQHSNQSWLTGWRLGWRQFGRDVRAGELRLLMFSVTLAVAALCAVGFLSERMQSALWRDARQLLGGDAVVVSDKPPPASALQEAQRLGLQTNTQMLFPTMARDPAPQGESRLVALKAVTNGYPLRGQLQLEQVEGHAPMQGSVPEPGQVWVDAALLEALNLGLQQNLALGDQVFRITAVIEREPDRGAGFMNFAPRVLINSADVPATGLVQAASRVTWRLAVIGTESRVQDYAAWVRERIATEHWRGVQLESLESGRPEMRQTLDRAAQFLNLVALLAALLCAVAVALAARDFAQRQLDACALLRVLGQNQRVLTVAYATEFFAAGLLASVAGIALGFGLHHALLVLLQGLVVTDLPPAGLRTFGVGLAVGLTLLVAFGLPPVLQLARVPALRVLRRDLGGLRLASGAVLVMALCGFALTLLVISRDLGLGAITVGGFALALLLFAGMAALLLRALRVWMPEQAPRWLRLATRQISAQPMLSVVQISSLSVGLLALVLLVLLRTDLLASWRQASPQDAPDRFVINVQPDQTQDFLAHLHGAGVRAPDWYPMVRGRLVAINGREVSSSDYSSDRAQRLVDREFNLSYTDQLPAHNPLLAGRWQAGERDGVSVEQGIADTLGLKLGDRLRFDMGGISHEARITSVRKVDWASMRANFFMLFPVADMPELPTTWLAAFRTPEGDRGFERALVQKFPNVTSVDMRASLDQVQRVLNQVVRAVEFLFAFTLAAGVVVLLAALRVGRHVREREFAIMRALGAGERLLAQVQRTELLGQGFVAGAMASAVALAMAWALARYAFDFAWSPVWSVVAVGGGLGAVLAWVAGSFSLRGVLRQPVVQTLRQTTV